MLGKLWFQKVARIVRPIAALEWHRFVSAEVFRTISGFRSYGKITKTSAAPDSRIEERGNEEADYVSVAPSSCPVGAELSAVPYINQQLGRTMPRFTSLKARRLSA